MIKSEFLNPLRKVYHRLIRANKFRDSHSYWENRYQNDGNSGWGSYDKFAEFKAEVINQFVEQHQIASAIEFGCGDGNQCQLLNLDRYIGIDISKTVIEQNQVNFSGDQSKEFYKDGAEEKQDLNDVSLALSLDVIYHLVEDDVFEKYMGKLLSYKYVIIYSSNFHEKQRNHVRHRKFSEWIDKNRSEWRILEHIPNRYPYDPKRPKETSPAEFFIYHNPQIEGRTA